MATQETQMTSKKNLPYPHLRYSNVEPDPTGIQAPPKPPEAKPMTQADIDAVVAKRVNEERAKYAKEQQTLLERLKQSETDAAKAAELQKQIEDIERAGKTKAQLEEMDRKKREQQLIDERDAAVKLANQTRATYEAEKLSRDLMDAASSKEADAFNAPQLASLLAPKARLVEKDGKMEVRVKHTIVKDGTLTEVDGTPTEVIKIMKDDPSNGNLFKAGITGGIGGTQVARTAAKVGGKIGLSQDEFNKLYAKGKLPAD